MSGAGVHVGAPPKEWEGWDSQLVHFHNFESLSTEKGHSVWSQKFSCCNHEWKLSLYPGGKIESRNGMVSIFLHHYSTTFSAIFTILVRNAKGGILEQFDHSSHKFEKGSSQGRGTWNFVNYGQITDRRRHVLDHGTLTIEVRIKPDEDNCCTNFIPKNDFAQNMMKSFMDKKSADVSFEVGGGTNSNPKAIFYAHKLILQFCAKDSFLTSICKGSKKSNPVPISDVDPPVFHRMLSYVYGGQIPVDEWKERSKDYIDAADRYGLKNLKIEAEAWYAKYCEITLDNVIDELLYAEEKNCFLLKELATNFILKNADKVLASDSFEKIPESKNITREIISLVAMSNKGDDPRDLNDPRKLSINELRARVHAKRKDIDSPRNALIAHLESKKKKPKVSQDEEPTNG